MVASREGPRRKPKALGLKAQTADRTASSREKPKAFGSVNWMVASMECPREKPMDLGLA
jgi:hypothetical protein